MKKLLLVLMSIFILFNVSACGKKDNNSSSDNVNENKTEIVKTECNKINNLLKVNYSKLTLTIKTDDSNVSLTSTYEISREDEVFIVKYSYEELNSFEVDGEIVIPTEYKTTKKGEIKIQNEKVIEQNGAPIDRELDRITMNPGFKFDEAYFSNEIVLNSKFRASVNNVKDFMGQEIDCSNMKLSVIYSNSALSSITLDYISKGKGVTVSYNFSN